MVGIEHARSSCLEQRDASTQRHALVLEIIRVASLMITHL